MAPYNFMETEKRVLEFWREHKIHAEVNKANGGGEDFYFLDGPPYTSGRVHIGTAWNKSLKDLILRYKRYRGYNVWDRAGYDMHGMPTEQGTEKELGIKNKGEIYAMGIGRFVSSCRAFAIRNMKQMNEDFRRLGVWMDFDDPYMPIERDYIEGEWWLIKKAHENNRLYEGEATTTWCSKCGTALAKHELEYEQLTDDSVYIKFPVKGKKGEYLIIWTTTPWTIPFNLGVMANPRVLYVRALVDGEIWICAEALAEAFIKGVAGKGYVVTEKMPGESLLGLEYVHPLENELGKEFDKYRAKSPKVHTVVMSEEYVDISAGTGLVHMAPGCGPEDYEVGHREGIPPFNELDQAGVFSRNMGAFAGWVAKKDDKLFVESLEETGLVAAKTKIEHDYAHCWRCKRPVVYRTTTQWFFRIEDLKDEMRSINQKIAWVPDFAGSRNFDSWLANLRDNGITRQRFWGTPLPVWKCDSCKEYVVVGSVAELESLSEDKIPDDLHKPWIDEVTVKCVCGGTKKRIPDILDVWIDAGSASWNCLRYPKRPEDFERLFPADFILEGIDQIRGWFNLLMVASMVSMNRASFDAVYMHGFVQDALGRKMSKSLGNYILPSEVIDKYGADTLRYYMVGGASPGIDINYNFEDMKIKNRNLHILWNLHNLVLDMARNNGLRPSVVDYSKLGLEERYIISKQNSIIKKLTERLDAFYLNEAPLFAEELFLELSRTYIQLVRDKISSESTDEKQLVLDVCYSALMDSLVMFSVTCPFICEDIFQSFRKEFGLDEKSLFMMKWPGFDEARIDNVLETNFDIASNIIQAALHLREKVKLGQRWPLACINIATDDTDILACAKAMENIILSQTNVKAMTFDKGSGPDFEESEWRGAKIALNKAQDQGLLAEGYAREIMRRIQNQRKKAGLQRRDIIDLCIVVEKDLEEMLKPWMPEIAQRTGAKRIDICGKLECKMQGHSSMESVKGKEVGICFEKIG
jgi:isoleucyl-tRNA synthetase